MCSAPDPPKINVDSRPKPRDENVDEAYQEARKRVRNRAGLNATVLTSGGSLPATQPKTLLGQ